ncbi:MAG: TolC family outer membrane protein [Alphaproteobacteria bacterium]|nr:TolC family outer membrane protein [Alphaproteobacteria bacterium]
MQEPAFGRRRSSAPFRTRAIIALAAVSAGTLAAAPRSAALTLTESLVAAYNNNPTLLAQRARLRESDEGVSQALSGWRPVVQFTGAAGVQTSDTTGFPTATQHPRSIDLNVTQPLYNGGRTTATTSQAENTVRSTRAQTLATEQSVLFSVVSAYMDVVQNQAVLDLSINNEQVLRRQLEATQDQFRVGEVTRTDVAQAESRLAAATASRVQAEGTLETSRAAFERLVGEPSGLLQPPAERPVLPANRTEAASLAANNNPNVISAQFVEAAARDNVRVVRSQLLPQVSIVGDFNKGIDTSVSLPRLTTDTASLTARLTVPLYEGGQVYSQTRQAIETIGQRRSELDDTRRQVVQTAQQDWEAMQADRANIRSLIETIRAAEISLEGTRQEALVGSRTILDILNAEQELFTDRVNLVRAQHDEVVTEFDLGQQVGRLTAVDLKLPVEVYDFDKHYKAVRDKWIGFSPSD